MTTWLSPEYHCASQVREFIICESAKTAKVWCIKCKRKSESNFHILYIEQRMTIAANEDDGGGGGRWCKALPVTVVGNLGNTEKLQLYSANYPSPYFALRILSYDVYFGYSGRCLDDAKLQLDMSTTVESLMALPVAILHFRILYTFASPFVVFFISHFICRNFRTFAFPKIIPSPQVTHLHIPSRKWAAG